MVFWPTRRSIPACIGTGTINGQGNVKAPNTIRPAGTGTGANRFLGPSYHIGTTVGTPTKSVMLGLVGSGSGYCRCPTRRATASVRRTR